MKFKKLKLRKAEEIANSISHGVGVALAIAGVILLNVFGALYGNIWHIISFSVFGISTILLFNRSSSRHEIRKSVQYRTK